MASPSFDTSFDPARAVRFDLSRGSASDSRGARLLLVPSSALESLDSAALAQVGAHLGRACGSRVATRFGGADGVCAMELASVATHLAGELAVAGLGSVQIEQWGRAMVAVVSNASIADDAFTSSVLTGALSAASGRAVAAAALGGEGDTRRYFVGSAATGARVRELVAQGQRFAEVLSTLQGGAS